MCKELIVFVFVFGKLGDIMRHNVILVFFSIWSLLCNYIVPIHLHCAILVFYDFESFCVTKLLQFIDIMVIFMLEFVMVFMFFFFSVSRCFSCFYLVLLCCFIWGINFLLCFFFAFFVFFII
jgi:hypothetical protein